MVGKRHVRITAACAAVMLTAGAGAAGAAAPPAVRAPSEAGNRSWFAVARTHPSPATHARDRVRRREPPDRPARRPVVGRSARHTPRRHLVVRRRDAALVGSPPGDSPAHAQQHGDDLRRHPSRGRALRWEHPGPRSSATRGRGTERTGPKRTLPRRLLRREHHRHLQHHTRDGDALRRRRGHHLALGRNELDERVDAEITRSARRYRDDVRRCVETRAALRRECSQRRPRFQHLALERYGVVHPEARRDARDHEWHGHELRPAATRHHAVRRKYVQPVQHVLAPFRHVALA